jgi:cellulose synthase/poly-beta-1,6-N-acetylglucosamine synthase-like glycosyltransferase
MAENTGSLPFVSVFVPARNEESGIDACLVNLLNQDYQGEFEILMGDDDSEDNTLSIAQQLQISNSQLRVFRIIQGEGEGSVQGKQRALAQLTEKASGEIFLFCDADMRMPSGWIRSMVSFLGNKDCDLINGTSCPPTDSIFHCLQALDWLLPQAAMSTLSKFGISYTAMGNNMGMSRKVYESVGGYGNIPFSVTEDYELFRHLKKNGYRLKHIYDTRVLGITQPSPNPGEWFSQHLRWTRGFRQLPLLQKLPFFLLMLQLPLLAGFSISSFCGVSTQVLLGLWILKLLYFSIHLALLGKQRLLLWLIPFECLFPPVYFMLFCTSLIRKSIVWKGRKL